MGVTVGVPVWVAVGGTNCVAVAVALGVVVGRGGPRGSATINGRNPLMAKVSASTERIQPRRPNQPIRVTIASPIHARFDMMNSIPRLIVQTAACSLSGEGKRVILELRVKRNGISVTYKNLFCNRDGPSDSLAGGIDQACRRRLSPGRAEGLTLENFAAAISTGAMHEEHLATFVETLRFAHSVRSEMGHVKLNIIL